jgi:hypothetical protein
MAGCVAAVALQHRQVAEAGPPLQTHGLLLAAAIGVAGMGWLAIHAKPLEAIGLVGTLAISAGWYALARTLRRR